MKRRLAIGGTVVLLLLGIWHAWQGSHFYLDVLVSLVGLLIILKLYDRTHQNTFTFSVFLFWLIMHNLGFYDKVIIFVGWDKWMHLLGGIAMALIAWQLFSKEKWSYWQRAYIVVICVVGMGGIHEIIEWVGFRQLGTGQGFLFYGAGDFGEWQNTILDMAANLVGALLVVGGKALKRN